MQFASWISQHGSLPIPLDTAAFGHAPGVTYASAAFYQVGNSLVPQFMAGLPMLLSLGFWAGGARVAVLWAPVLGALGIFTFGGLVARLVGPRWAPLGALAMAITIPEPYVSRNTYSETLAQILFLGALSLWIDSQRTDRGDADAGRWRANWRSHSRSASHVLAGVTGLLFGITLLVRIDGPADILFVIPYCGLLVLRRQRQVIALVVGPARRHGVRRGGRGLPDPAVPEGQQVVGQAAGRRHRPDDRGHAWWWSGGCAGAATSSGHPFGPRLIQAVTDPAVPRHRRLHHPALRGAQLARAAVRAAQPALAVLVHGRPDHRVHRDRLRHARPPLHAGRGARLGAPAGHLRLVRSPTSCSGRPSPRTSPTPAAGWPPRCCRAWSCSRSG